ncbi:MAG: hypothetical protein V1898_01195 [Patescibacteria group bacterium]
MEEKIINKEQKDNTEIKSKPEKKKINKVIIIINVVALLVIFSVVGYMVYDKYFAVKSDQRSGRIDFNNMSIEDICNNMQDRPTNVNRANRQMPDNVNAEDFQQRRQGNGDSNFNRNVNRGDFAGGSQDANFNPETMRVQMQLIQTICADGEVSAEEKAQFEELKNNQN